MTKTDIQESPFSVKHTVGQMVNQFLIKKIYFIFVYHMTQLNIVLFSGKVLNCLEQVDMKNLFEINYFLNKN